MYTGWRHLSQLNCNIDQKQQINNSKTNPNPNTNPNHRFMVKSGTP